MHSKFVGHSTEIIWQSKIKGPLARAAPEVPQDECKTLDWLVTDLIQLVSRRAPNEEAM